MTANIPPSPNLGEADVLIADMFETVKEWEGSLAGRGTRLKVGAQTVKSLSETRVTFGNPEDNFVALTPAVMEQAGIELSNIRKQQMKTTHNFYYMTLSVDLQPEASAQFKSIRCRLDLGPKGEQEPIVQTIFPQSKWKDVLTWGGGLNLGLDGNLAWNAGVDASRLANIANLPVELQASVGNKNKLKSFIVVPDYSYNLGRLEIGAFGEGNSECFWDIQDPKLQTALTVKFAIVFKVPKEVKSIDLQGTAWVEPKISLLTENIERVFGRLSKKLQTLLLNEDEAADKFARGVDEIWDLPLPEAVEA